MSCQMVYTGIRVKNMDRSVRFYVRALGMKVRDRARNPGIHGEWAQLESPRTHQLLELNYYSPRSPFYTPWTRGVEIDHLCFRVDRLGPAVRRLRAAGAKRLGGPYEVSGWRMIDLADPNGICLELGTPVRLRRSRRS